MGLDMYLYRMHRDVVGYKDFYLDDVKKNDLDLYLKLGPHIHQRGTPGVHTWESLYEELGYWRKANAIHGWFVENVQDGEDDCKDHEVSEEQLGQLLLTATRVLDKCKLIPGEVEAGFISKGDKFEPTYEAGLVVEDTSVAEELLPTECGFFFGSTQYNEYYVRDIEYTIEVVRKALATTDFKREVVYYRSSW